MMKQRIEPGPGQESVWDYPRPPRVEACQKHLTIIAGGITIGDTKRSFRVLETSHPPVYYLPPDDLRMDLLRPGSTGSFCEWKGHAHYFSLNGNGREIENVAWCYPTPSETFRAIAGYLAFYPGKMDVCLVDGEQVQAQAGDFYGGWITSDIVGPFKGGPGSLGW
ncbi:DUF427 domain-containing protein [Stieleria maiorica]|nr:DUF427 domain-containing protein [Stieleria maiorica]